MSEWRGQSHSQLTDLRAFRFLFALKQQWLGSESKDLLCFPDREAACVHALLYTLPSVSTMRSKVLLPVAGTLITYVKQRTQAATKRVART